MGRLAVFSFGLRSCYELLCRPPKGRVQLWQGKGGHYKELIRGTISNKLGGALRVQGCATIYPRGAPSIFSHRGSRNQEQRSEACVQRSEKREESRQYQESR